VEETNMRRDPKSNAKNPNDALYMSASEAAAALNISVPTLYTYVTRKNIRSHKPDGSRASRYLRSDIEQLKSGITSSGSRDATPGLTASSSITLVTDSGTYYRGISAIELSKKASLEDVARILWATADTDPFGEPVHNTPANWNELFAASASFDPISRITMLLPVIEANNPRAFDLSKPAFWLAGVEILRSTAAVFLNQAKISPLPIHQYIAAVTQCGAELEDIVRRVLVLGADQALEPTTYAVRATANTGATPYRCVISGLSASTGKRLPSARAASFARFINEIDSSSDPTEPVMSRVRESEDVPGFGFSPFATQDPRSGELLAALRDVLANDRKFLHFDGAIRVAAELTGKHPDFAFLASYVGKRIGLNQQANLVRLARIVGWLAHALEQQTDKPLMRWRVNYVGSLPT
jgi:citrate synthase